MVILLETVSYGPNKDVTLVELSHRDKDLIQEKIFVMITR